MFSEGPARFAVLERGGTRRSTSDSIGLWLWVPRMGMAHRNDCRLGNGVILRFKKEGSYDCVSLKDLSLLMCVRPD